MPNGERPGILGVTEEQIFRTLGRPTATICSLLSGIDRNEESSIRAIDQISKQMIVPGNVSGSLQRVRESHLDNLERVRNAEKAMNCQ